MTDPHTIKIAIPSELAWTLGVFVTLGAWLFVWGVVDLGAAVLRWLNNRNLRMW